MFPDIKKLPYVNQVTIVFFPLQVVTTKAMKVAARGDAAEPTSIVGSWKSWSGPFSPVTIQMFL